MDAGVPASACLHIVHWRNLRVRRPIRRQILIPFGLLLMLAVGATAVTSSVLAARRSSQQRIEHLRNVVDTLGDATFPFTQAVLDRMRGLSGAHFIAADASDAVVASTLAKTGVPAQLDLSAHSASGLEQLSEYPAVSIGDEEYFIAAVSARRATKTAALFVLYPVSRWYGAQWDAAWPPLAIGFAAFVLMAAAAAWLSQRIAGRIESVRQLFANIAEGNFTQVEVRPPHDEVQELVCSANQLSSRLASMQDEIRGTERLRLLAQLAGGLAHQLRNAVTGARMAVQLHQRRCESGRIDESLEVALRQLTLTEQHVKGLLSLGKQRPGSPRPRGLEEILADVARLVEPACRHGGVSFSAAHELPGSPCSGEGDALQAALLNLTLNAIEAAGEGGTVELRTVGDTEAVRIEVLDSGSGPAEELGDSLFEPFVSTKPEGVGLGLALAQQAAELHGGTLSWQRRATRTVFMLCLPCDGEVVWNAAAEPFLTIPPAMGNMAGRVEVPTAHVLHDDVENPE